MPLKKLKIIIKKRALFSFLIAIAWAAYMRWDITTSVWGFWTACLPMLFAMLYYIFHEPFEEHNQQSRKNKTAINNFSFYFFYMFGTLLAASIIGFFYFSMGAIFWKTFPPAGLIPPGAEVEALEGLAFWGVLALLFLKKFWLLVLLTLGNIYFGNIRIGFSKKWSAQQKALRVLASFLWKFLPLVALTLLISHFKVSFDKSFTACFMIFFILYLPLRLRINRKEGFPDEYF